MENIQRTVQSALQTIGDGNTKNESFEKIVTDIKKSKDMRDAISALLQRNINSSNELEWEKFVQNNNLALDDLKVSIEQFKEFVRELRELNEHQEQISVNL